MRTDPRMVLTLMLIVAIAVMADAIFAQPGRQSIDSDRPSVLPERWVFSHGYGRTPGDVIKIKALVETAADHGLNGIVLSAFGLDEVSRWQEADVAFLEEIKALCDERDVELIPIGFSAGHGGGALKHDRNFAAALPITIELVAAGGKAAQVFSKGNLIRNGGFEKHHGERFESYSFHDQPGEVSFVDTRIAASGNASIRFENFSKDRHGLGRIMQEVQVKPGCSYRLSAKIKTQDLQPLSGVRLLVLKEKDTLMLKLVDVRPTQDWTEISAEFTNYSETEVRVYAGIWRGTKGKFWLDDLELREVGSLSGIVRRDGTPLELRSRDRDMTFVEGTDFAAVKNIGRLDHIELPADTRIREDENLVLSCYKTSFVHKTRGRQTSLCMSNPDLYVYWETQAHELYEMIGYKKFLLSMDEIRNGGGCELCRQSGKSMAQILGECITRQYEILKKIDPGIEVLIWSDMLDPGHNAREDYFGVVGSFSGSWKYVPEDLIIVCWHQGNRNKSLKFFSERGFRTIGAAYYDTGDLDGSREWLESLQRTPGATGIIYTSWKKQYRLLADFGDMVSGIVNPK